MDDAKLREQLVSTLGGHGAHMSFDQAVKGFPRDLIGKRVPNLAHTAWQLVFHIWIAQWDILDFVTNPSYESRPWPEAYWPAEDAPRPLSAWEETLGKIKADLKAVMDLVRDAGNDLFAPIPHGQGQTLLREALLVIDHTSYHVGQLVDLRRLLGISP
ncbi:MAG: DinB family protein [Spirochaetia bacterium]